MTASESEEHGEVETIRDGTPIPASLDRTLTPTAITAEQDSTAPTADVFVADPVKIEADGVFVVGEDEEAPIARADPDQQPYSPSRNPMNILGRAIIACVSSSTGKCLLFTFALAMVGLSITFLVFTIIGLARTSNEHQKDICHRSDAWICVLVHLLVGGFIYNNNDSKNDDDDGDNAAGKTCCQLLKGLTQVGMAIWGIYELFGVSCVNDLKGKLLFIILQIYVILDMISIGCYCLILCSMGGYFCCKRNCSLSVFEGRSDASTTTVEEANVAIPATEVPANQASAVMEV